MAHFVSQTSSFYLGNNPPGATFSSVLWASFVRSKICSKKNRNVNFPNTCVNNKILIQANRSNVFSFFLTRWGNSKEETSSKDTTKSRYLECCCNCRKQHMQEIFFATHFGISLFCSCLERQKAGSSEQHFSVALFIQKCGGIRLC